MTPMRYGGFFISLLFLCGSCREHTSGTDSAKFPQVFAPKSYTDCYNAAGFFRANKDEINSRLPKGFTARDAGSILGSEYNGYSFLVFIYFSCPSSYDDSSFQTTIIATPIEEPALANDLRTVRWNLYEFARLAGTLKQADELSALGLSVQHATLSNTPFHKGDTVAFFKADVLDGLLFEVGARLTDSVNFEAQSHRLWHQRADGHLVTTRLDFEYHHSWIGKLKSCSYDAGLLTVSDLKGIECTEVGITEAIESVSFTENIILWR
jgi:hypothetical protein